MFAHLIQDLSSDMSMFVAISGKDENVVEIHRDDPFHDEIVEYLIHHGLEGGRTIGEAKVHDQWFKEATIGAKCGLPLITLLNSDIIVPPTDVELGKVLRAFESVNEVIDEREWVSILPCDHVKCPIVLVKVKFTILLLDEQDQGTQRGFGWPNAAGGQGLLQERVQLHLFGQHHWVDFPKSRRWFVFQFDHMIPLPTFRESVKSHFTEYVFIGVKCSGDDFVKTCWHRILRRGFGETSRHCAQSTNGMLRINRVLQLGRLSRKTRVLGFNQ
jgi:hypothetical protein